MDDEYYYEDEPMFVGSGQGVSEPRPNRLSKCRSVSRAAEKALTRTPRRPVGFFIPPVR